MESQSTYKSYTKRSDHRPRPLKNDTYLYYAPKLTFVSNSFFSINFAVKISPNVVPKPLNMPIRIVSLVPSITELLVHLGFADYLVGRTGFCIHPGEVVKNIPKVGGTKTVHLDKIRALSPTHVVVNVDENDKLTVDALRDFVPHVVVTHPCVPTDNLSLIDQLLQALVTADLQSPYAINLVAACAINTKAAALKAGIDTRIAKLQLQRVSQPTQRVLYLIWRKPWMTVARNTYISQMLALVGWQTWPDVQGGDGVSAPGAGRYPVLTTHETWLADIDRVLLSSEPYSFGAQHVQEVQAWLPQARVQLVDGEMLSWYGSRAVPGLDYLAGLAGTSVANSGKD